jgi:acetylornithine aminotransferase
LNEIDELEILLQKGNIAGIIIEGIQGVGGIQVPNPDFLQKLSELCKSYEAKLILDEVQSGYGRTGKFFAHQWVTDLVPDMITMAKGMGNGYPIGGVLIHPDIKASFGLLGTTFGGNHLACAAGLAVLEILEKENLQENAQRAGDYLMHNLAMIAGITEVRGKGLMVGIDLEKEAAPIRSELVSKYRIFTGSSAGKHTIRLLPPLNIEIIQLSSFLDSLKMILS